MKRTGKVTGRWSGRKYGGKLQDQVNQLADARKVGHRKHIKENRGGRDDRPAGTPGATKLYSRAEELGFTKRRTKYPLGKPLYVHMTEGRIAANAQAEAERTAAEKWHKISGLIFIHPCDFHIGQDVHWHRAGKVLRGTVVKVNDDMLKPAKVLRRGPVRYHYTPSVYAYCDKNGDKPCVCDLPTGQRSECQHKPGCPVPGINKQMGRRKPVVYLDMETRYDGPPGVKLMQGHSPAMLAGITSHNRLTRPAMTIKGALMGPDEYASDIDGRERPWQYTVADYDVRAGRDGKFGIYTRKYDVRLATFAPNSAALRNALARMFNAANALKQSEITKFKRSKLPVGKQIALRQADERKINKGWYTCQCGQWVNDKTCPCSVCRAWGVADARVKLPKGHRFRYLTDGAD